MRILLVILALFSPPLRASEVDMELVLAVDISRSMSHLDLAIQRRGYAEALTSEPVLAAIESGFIGRIGLTYVEWSDVERQRVIVDWTLIDTAQDAADVAAKIVRETGGTLRMTSLSSGLIHAAAQFDKSPFTSFRKVIDISGDGPNNTGLPVTSARDQIVAEGITINGLPLMVGRPGDRWFMPDLDIYFENCVTGGPGAFVVPVFGWETFGDAIKRKLVLEIAGLKARAPQPRLHPASGYDCLIGEKILRRNRTK